MPSKVVRISEEALKAASEYAEDLSTAVLIMHAKIEELRRAESQTKELAEIKAGIEELKKNIPDEKTLKKFISGTVTDCFADYSRGY